MREFTKLNNVIIIIVILCAFQVVETSVFQVTHALYYQFPERLLCVTHLCQLVRYFRPDKALPKTKPRVKAVVPDTSYTFLHPLTPPYISELLVTHLLVIA